MHNKHIVNTDEPITEIRTHSHAFPQCERFLTQYHPDVERVETSSTAQAVEDIVNRKGAAAIASRKVAELYRVPIIAENIGDNSHNATRFFLLGRGETEPTGNDTTTLAFVPEINGPGTLLDYLRPFAERGIDMTKIDSHPSGKMGKYLFLISIDGHSKDAKISKAVSELGVICEQIKILGSYKKADIPEGVNVPGTWNGD